MVPGWNISPNVGYLLVIVPGVSSCAVILYKDDGALVASGAALTGTEQPCVLVPQFGQNLGMVDVELGWHLLVTTTGTESQRAIRIGPAVDLPDEIHPVYSDENMALARATAAIDEAAHYRDDMAVACPLGLNATLGAVVSAPVDGVPLVGQAESITWTGTPDGTSEPAVIRRHVAIAPDAFVEPEPVVPPVVVDDVGTTDSDTATSGNVLTNDAAGLVVVAVNGLAANVGAAVNGDNGGSFTIASDGSWIFDPDGDFALLASSETADTSVTYYASDGTGEAMATLTVTVTSAVVVDTDPYWDNVAFLSHFDGAVGSKPTVDEKGASMTAYTNVAISDVQSKFSNTLKFDGTCPSYLAIARHSGFDFGSGDFTIEMHLFLNNTPSSYYSLFSTSFSNSPWYGIRFRVESTRKLSVLVSYNGTTAAGQFQTTLMVPVASWCHVAFVRKASTLYLFIDGQVAGTLGGITGALYYSTREPVQVGVDFSAHYTVCSRTYLNGYIDDLRVTQGIARYDDAFTVPQLQFPSE
jgi:VCBS repeat-containing protein